METLLSFIIPVYNGAGVIENSIRSILALKEPSVEIIIINDGSTDHTMDILRRLSEDDGRVIILSQKNGGVSSARNRGLSCAKGQYVTFVDSDDAIDNESYSPLLDLIKESQKDLYCFDYIEETDGAAIRHYKQCLKPGINQFSGICEEMLQGKYNNVWCSIYKRDIITDHHIEFPVSMKMGEDAAFNIKYIRYCSEIFYYNVPLYLYSNRASQSAMHQYRIEYLSDYVLLFDLFYELHLLRPDIKMDLRERHYLSRIFGSLFYSEADIRTEEEKKLRNSFLYKLVIRQAFYDQKRDLLKRELIRLRIYRIKSLKKIIAHFRA